MAYDPYPSVTNYNPYSANTALYPVASGTTEIDLRAEFRRFLYGYGREIPKGQRGLLRRMRLDDDGKLIECVCLDEVTKEPEIDYACPYCAGEGYLWTEEWITFYKVEVSTNEGLVRKDNPEKAGIYNIPYTFFYVEYFVNPSGHDKVIEVDRELDGKISSPYRRSAIYTMSRCQPFRSDSGRIEYWRLAGAKRSIKSTWQ